jgi:hypothetical protein
MATVLLATDDGGATVRARNRALSHAWRLHATLHVLCVVGDDHDRGASDTADSDPSATEAPTAGTVTDVTARAERLGIDVVTHVRRGAPVETICEYAADLDPELSVVSLGTAVSESADRVIRRLSRRIDCETQVLS